MNYASLLFFGAFLSFALSWAGMVLLPQLQIGRQSLVPSGPTAQLYPAGRSGSAEQGRIVYRSLGCAACHTQQVRPSDAPRWGQRMTVAQDYVRDEPVLLGTQRIGPDLSNIGLRMPDMNWHLQHLYNPKFTVPGSPMPANPFLFEYRKINGTKSPNALILPAQYAPAKGFEIVPSREALVLVAYLQSLRIDNYLFEAPNPHPPAGAGSTNAVTEALDRGRTLYATTCAACHQQNGLGLPNQFPPLAGSEWVLATNADNIIRIVLNGVTGPFQVKGLQFNNTMVPWKDVLADDDIAAVISYIRNEWGNRAPLVKPQEVAAVREATKDRSGPWTYDELMRLPTPAREAKQ